MNNISTRILEAVNENEYKEYREDTVYNYFTEIISYLSNKEIKKLADSLIEYVENDKLFDKEDKENEEDEAAEIEDNKKPWERY